MAPRTSNRSCAAAKRWPWSEEEIPPGRPRCSCRKLRRKVHMLVRSGGAVEHDVALPDPAHYRESAHRTALQYRDHRRWTATRSLERVTWQDKTTGETSLEVRHVFIMTGASPRTEWLQGCVALDDKGFILTGRDLDRHRQWFESGLALRRSPQMLETSLPAVFAVGDVRSGNVKRVASAVAKERSRCTLCIGRWPNHEGFNS